MKTKESFIGLFLIFFSIPNLIAQTEDLEKIVTLAEDT